jgi:hypothetical protein
MGGGAGSACDSAEARRPRRSRRLPQYCLAQLAAGREPPQSTTGPMPQYASRRRPRSMPAKKASSTSTATIRSGASHRPRARLAGRGGCHPRDRGRPKAHHRRDARDGSAGRSGSSVAEGSLREHENLLVKEGSGAARRLRDCWKLRTVPLAPRPRCEAEDTFRALMTAGRASSPHVRSADSPRRATPHGGQQPLLRCRGSSGIGRASHPATSTRAPQD